MSRKRQSADPPALLVRTLAVGYASGTLLEQHAHPWGQLVYAAEGVMSVQTADGTWVVPSHRAVWIPAHTEHSIAMSGRVAMRTLYLAPELLRALPDRCSVLAMTPLARELVLHAVAIGALRSDVAAHVRLVDFLLDHLGELPAVVPFELPLPRDPRALRVARRLRDDPAGGVDVAVLVRSSGASRRTLERLFLSETGLTLGRWQQQARLLHAMRLLASGASVTSVALDVGYQTTSAFVAAFARALGTTPGRYARDRAEPAAAPSARDRAGRSLPGGGRDMGRRRGG
ncbi:MAG TPA: helix-turn-helix transcriptional regulator [Candidatus Binatia bacterium]|nr:helix-turn-helix transcriptional regulator [Candidatus Binatia bacterium]